MENAFKNVVNDKTCYIDSCTVYSDSKCENEFSDYSKEEYDKYVKTQRLKIFYATHKCIDSQSDLGSYAKLKCSNKVASFISYTDDECEKTDFAKSII